MKKLQNVGGILDRNFTVLVGKNNSGKSRILCDLFSGRIGLGRNATIEIVSPDRFEFRDRSFLPYDDARQRESINVNRAQAKASQSSEVPPSNPWRDIASLPSNAREALFEWHRQHIGEISIKRSDPQNEFSPASLVFEKEEREIHFQGSGSRALLHLLSRLFDPTMVGLLLIDEPEIGLYSSLQKKVMTLLQSFAGTIAPIMDMRGIQNKKIAIATHSHNFLDRISLDNNFIVNRYNDHQDHDLQQVETDTELHDLVYKQLGCSPTDLFMPRNVILVEGPSDERFITKILKLKSISDVKVHHVEGCGKMKTAILALDQILKSFAYLPLYKKRGCMILDSDVSPSIVSQWRKYLSDAQVLHLEKSGVEYYYPRSILQNLFGPGAHIDDDSIKKFIGETKSDPQRAAMLGQQQFTKVQLAEHVADNMTNGHLSEIDPCILNLIDAADSLSKV